MGQPREVMDRVTEALLSKNFEALRDLYAADVTWVNPDKGPMRGLDALIESFRDMFEAFPDASYEATGSWETGEYVFDQGDFIATNSGTLKLPGGQELPPTGKQVRLRDMEVARVQDGRITHHEWYWDQLDMLNQLGLVQLPAATRA